MEKNERFYTVAEAAKILRFSPLTIYRWIKSRKLKAKKIGGKSYRIKASDLSVFLQS
jgi:excisionase family DNA binding protein